MHLRAHDFANVTFSKNKFQPCDQDDDITVF